MTDVSFEEFLNVRLPPVFLDADGFDDDTLVLPDEVSDDAGTLGGRLVLLARKVLRQGAELGVEEVAPETHQRVTVHIVHTAKEQVIGVHEIITYGWEHTWMKK